MGFCYANNLSKAGCLVKQGELHECLSENYRSFILEFCWAFKAFPFQLSLPESFFISSFLLRDVVRPVLILSGCCIVFFDVCDMNKFTFFTPGYERLFVLLHPAPAYLPISKHPSPGLLIIVLLLQESIPIQR